MESLGICIGASSIKMVRLRPTDRGPEIVDSRVRSHEGDSRGVLLEMLRDVPDLDSLKVAATGRKFRSLLTLPSISEPEAVELAVAHLFEENDRQRTIISAGGETFLVYRLDPQGRIQSIHTGNKCASGTGEFLLQQLSRMDMDLSGLGEVDVTAPAHRVSGRCSVFCKSDCTHALNKGVPRLQVVSGLARMMAEKCLELLKKLPKEGCVLTGGCAANSFMVHYLRQELPGLFVPEEAPYAEALGAALWALEHDLPLFPGLERIFQDHDASFSFLKPLSDFKDMVAFKSQPRGEAQAGDRVVVGLDVGSTTTKGVVLRLADNAILAGEYLRTMGDPVAASRRVYGSLSGQLAAPVEIVGLGVTGSGRAIAGLHAGAEGVINEIIAHATAAVHFDPRVETIFEIGGQDAKYTSIQNGVPCDYAMNEACSAGTGSFLEESAKETLGVSMEDIGPLAYKGRRPPNFNDQCAAFISSDIKIATQEGLPLNDILAGLVYSICMNYANRVKGNRPMGGRIFMQGGVCYNEAVPAAMAALTGKKIVVPPEPGLMGAFGVALEVKNRIHTGLMAEQSFDLDRLAAREVRYKSPFRCKGGREKCDRNCEIARIEIEGKTYPFGGICNRYENIVRRRKVDATRLNLVAARERMALDRIEPAPGRRPSIGLNRSYLIHTYLPMFEAYFSTLGLDVVLPDECDPLGVDQRGSAFCYPGELAHGYLKNLLDKKPDYLFLPHVRSVPADSMDETSCTCVLVQGESYYLRTAFPEIGDYGPRAFFPIIDMGTGFEAAEPALRPAAKALGFSETQARQAFQAALDAQHDFRRRLKRLGRRILAELAEDPERVAVVQFGRPYNAFASEANKAVPAKFATRGTLVIPFDALPYEDEKLPAELNMYWGLGRTNMQAARFVARHPQLFGCFITNFSCGPDSFILSYFRDAMGKKPSLTLELDSHTADAGLETRIEAFLDIVAASRQLGATVGRKRKPAPDLARIAGDNGRLGVVTSPGEWLPFSHERVLMLVPSMGRFGTPILAKSLASGGIRAEVVPPADEEMLKIGRGNSSCKECLPLQLTIGTMIHHLRNRDPEEVSVYLMPSAVGPCRFGQYNVFSRRTIELQDFKNAAVFAPNSINGYGGLSDSVMLKVWQAIVTGDIMEEVHSSLLAGAENVPEAEAVFHRVLQDVVRDIDKDWKVFARTLDRTARRLAAIPMRTPYQRLPKVALVGEIYVRHDPISRQRIIERLARRGFAVRTSKVSEWIKYTDYLNKTAIEGRPSRNMWIKLAYKRYFEERIRSKLVRSGLIHHHEPPVAEVMKDGAHFISPQLTGEAILTVGAAFHEIFDPACGVISIGPFGCMPSRLAEAVLSETFTAEQVSRMAPSKQKIPGAKRILDQGGKLPFLAIETDGNPFPQIIEARLEAFLLQAQRLHEAMVQG
ncbi:MAG: acyl-CoA dehydratase activase [Desulfovibrionaceae bacterium]